MDRAKFEDECRQLMGTGSYLLFTLDRVVNHAVKQLQALVSEPLSV
jgi:histone deacetylase complex regulatory component SIN3